MGWALAAGLVGGAVAWWATARPERWGLERAVRPRWRVPLVGVAGAVLAVAVALGHPAGAVALWAAVLAAGADMVDRVIPHRWLAVMLAAAAVRLMSGSVAWAPDLVLAAALGAFFLLAHLVSRGGFGMGDVKLGVAMSLVLGWPAGFSAVVLGLLVGGAVWPRTCGGPPGHASGRHTAGSLLDPWPGGRGAAVTVTGRGQLRNFFRTQQDPLARRRIQS